MAKVVLICGKICVGKSTYAKTLCEKERAVLLSCDEITLALFGCDVEEDHDEYVKRTQNYLFVKALEIVKNGINVVLDWGFWQKDERDFAKMFFGSRGVACELHYLEIPDEEWYNRIRKRNASVLSGGLSAYYVDGMLAQKFGAMFEKPAAEELDVWMEGDSQRER